MHRLDNLIDPVTDKPVSEDMARAIIGRTTGERTKYGGRIRVVDVAFNPVPMNLPARGNRPRPEVNDLSQWVMPATAVTALDVTNYVQRTLDFTMIDPLEDDDLLLRYDTDNHLLQPAMRLESRGVTIELPLCTFLMQEPKIKVYRNRRVYTFKGQDVSCLIDLADLISDWTVTAPYSGIRSPGNGHIQALLDLLTSHATPKSLGGQGQTPQGNDDGGPALPIGMFDVDWTGNQPVAIPLPGRAGTKRTQFAAQIAAAINYWPVHLSNGTRFLVRRVPDLSTAPPPATWDYSTTGQSIVDNTGGQGIDQDLSVIDACNLTRVEGGQSTQTGLVPFTRTKANTDPNSRFSFTRLKTLSGEPRVMAKFISNANLANQAMVDLYADYTLALGNLLANRVTVATLPHPGHEAYEYPKMLVTWKNGRAMIGSTATPFLEVAWNLPFLDPKGRMQHTLASTSAE